MLLGVDYFFNAFHIAFALIFDFDPELFLIAATSTIVSVTATTLAAVIGIPCAMAITICKFKGRGIIILFLNTLIAIPTVVIGIFCYSLLSRHGPLGNLGLLFTPAGIILGETLLALPITTSLTIAAVQAADPRLILTCKSLGASLTQQARTILYETRFAVVAAIVTAFGRVISEVGVAMILGGNIKGFTRTMTTAIALETSKGEFSLGLGLGILLLIVALGLNLFLYLLQK